MVQLLRSRGGRLARVAIALVAVLLGGLAQVAPAAAATPSCSGPLTGRPAAGNNADGRLEVFVTCLGETQSLAHQWQSLDRQWSGWAQLGGDPSGWWPVVASNADGRLETFVRTGGGGHSAVLHNWQVRPNGPWASWRQLPGLVTDGSPVVGRNADGRLEVFVRGADGQLWHAWQRVPNGGWSTWSSLGGSVAQDRDPKVDSNADGRLEVFVPRTDGQVWHLSQTAPNGGWSNWSSLQGAQQQGLSAVGRNADGRLEIFGFDGTRTLWHRWQLAANGGWSAWYRMKGNPPTDKQIEVGRNADGRLELFTLGSGARGAAHAWQTAPNADWSAWSSLGPAPVERMDFIGVGRNADGRLELFAVPYYPPNGQQRLWHVWQTAPNSGWSGWSFIA